MAATVNGPVSHLDLPFSGRCGSLVSFSSATHMNFPQQNLSPLVNKPDKCSDECKVNKRVCLLYVIQKNPSTIVHNDLLGSCLTSSFVRNVCQL